MRTQPVTLTILVPTVPFFCRHVTISVTTKPPQIVSYILRLPCQIKVGTLLVTVALVAARETSLDEQMMVAMGTRTASGRLQKLSISPCSARLRAAQQAEIADYIHILTHI